MVCKTTSLLLLVLFVLQAQLGSSLTVSIDAPSTPQVLSLTSSPPVGLTVTPSITLSATDGSTSSLQVSPPTLTFTHEVVAATYVVTGTAEGSYIIQWTTSGPDAGSYNFQPTFVTVLDRVVHIPLGSSASVYRNQESFPFLVYTDFPVVNGITVTLTSSNNDFTVNPSTLQFGPGDWFQTFTVTASGAQEYGTVTYTLSGTDAPAYELEIGATDFFSFYLEDPGIYITGHPTLFVDQTSVPLVAFVNDPPADGLSVDMTAADVTFSSSTLNFDSSTPVQFYTVSSTTATAKNVEFYTGGPDIAEYVNVSASPFTVNQRYFTVTGPSHQTYVNIPFIVGVTTVLSPPNGMTITPYATDFILSNSSLQFGNGITGITFEATPLNTYAQLSDIFFSTTGADEAIYTAAPSPLGINTVSNLGFFHTFNDAQLYVGFESDLFYLTIYPGLLDGSGENLVVTPYSAYATFNPPQFIFGNNTQIVSYTVTPAFYANGFVTINYAISGNLAWNFNAPSPITFYAQQRSIQLYPQGNISAQVGAETGPYTISILIPPVNNFSIVLSTPFVTFTPSVLTFTPTKTYETFTFHSNVTGNFYFQQLLEGYDANLYALPSQTIPLNVYIRSFYITYPENTGYYVPFGNTMTITITASSKPKNGVTITPYNPNLQFTPSAVVFGTGDLVKTLQIKGKASGFHYFFFNVTGTDASWYNPPDPTNLFVIVEQANLNAGGKVFLSSSLLFVVFSCLFMAL